MGIEHATFRLLAKVTVRLQNKAEITKKVSGCRLDLSAWRQVQQMNFCENGDELSVLFHMDSLNKC